MAQRLCAVCARPLLTGQDKLQRPFGRWMHASCATPPARPEPDELGRPHK